MRSLLVLVLLWLGFQFCSLLLESGQDRSRSRRSPSAEQVATVLERWPSPSRHIAENMIAQCGQPDLAEEGILRWDHRSDVGIVLYRDSVNHPVKSADPPHRRTLVSHVDSPR